MLNFINHIIQIQFNSEMENVSRMSSSIKDKSHIPSKLFSTYTSHTRCESVSKPSKNNNRKIQKLHTQMISSRKYKSNLKNCQNQIPSKQVASAYRTSFSSTKCNRKKNSCAENIKCQSSYNLKDFEVSKQMMNSSELFNSLYVEPMQIMCLLQKDNKPSLRSTQTRKKRNSYSKNQVSTKRSTILPNTLTSTNFWKKSQQNLKSVFRRSKSKQTQASNIKQKQRIKQNTEAKTKQKACFLKQTLFNLKQAKNKGKRRYQQKLKKSSMILSPTQQSFSCSKICLDQQANDNSNNQQFQQAISTPYSDILSRTYEILGNYQKKIKRLYEDKVCFQRLYEKSQIQCEHLRKSLKKKQQKNHDVKIYSQTTVKQQREQVKQKINQKPKDLKISKDTLKNSSILFRK